MIPNPFTAVTAVTEAVKAQIDNRVDAIFADIDAEETPLASGVKSQGTGIFDLLDGVVHAIAELEKQVTRRDKAA